MPNKPSLKVLIVDDEASCRSLAIQCLEGHERKVAASCEEAWHMYGKFKPHMTFLDMNLTDGNGLTFLQDLLKQDANAYVVMLTSNRRTKNVRLAMSIGAKGYIVKPFNKKIMLQHINKCIDVYGPENIKTEVYAEAPPDPVLPEPTDNKPRLSLNDVYQNWRVLFADSYHHNCEGARRAFHELKSEIVTVQDGEMAWKLLQSSSFQLIFLEAMLPQRNGYDLAKMIREKQHGDEFQSYIIGMEADFGKESKKWLYAGMNECISKPISLAGLQKLADKYATAYFNDFRYLLERLIKANEIYPNASSTLADFQQKLDDYSKDISDFRNIVGHSLRDPFLDLYDTFKDLQANGETLTKAELSPLLPLFETVGRRLEVLKEYMDLKELRPHMEIVDMSDVIKKVLAQLKDKIKTKSAYINLDGAFAHVVGNERLLQKLVHHIIDNALNFSDEKPTIDITCKESGANFIFTFEDNGNGIDPLHTKLALRPFLHFDAEERNRDGDGMGLAIAKQILDLHDGKLWLEPLKPKGTACSFYLPKRSKVN